MKGPGCENTQPCSCSHASAFLAASSRGVCQSLQPVAASACHWCLFYYTLKDQQWTHGNVLPRMTTQTGNLWCYGGWFKNGTDITSSSVLIYVVSIWIVFCWMSPSCITLNYIKVFYLSITTGPSFMVKLLWHCRRQKFEIVPLYLFCLVLDAVFLIVI